MKTFPDGAETFATPRRIEEAALDLFFERGYAATTMREIALACGMTAGALYNHFPSKDQLLTSILWRVHLDLERALQAAQADGDDGPRARLRALARAQALFHTNHPREATVANHEIRSLPEPDRSEITALRRRMRGWFEDAVRAGAAAGTFDCPDADATVKAILYAGIGISQWFSPNGPLGAEAVADLHAELALRMVTPGAVAR